MNSPATAKQGLVIDASLVVSLITSEANSPIVLALWRRWLAQEVYLLAPDLWRYEVVAVLWKKVRRGELTQAEAHTALEQALTCGLDHVQPTGLHAAALDLAARLSLPATYDAHYLALAQMVGCPLWTADARLYHAARAAGLTLRAEPQGEAWVHCLSLEDEQDRRIVQEALAELRAAGSPQAAGYLPWDEVSRDL